MAAFFLSRSKNNVVRPDVVDDPWAKFREQLALADNAQHECRWNQAAQLYIEAINLNAEAVGLHMQVGHMLKEADDYDGALEHYELYLKYHQDDVEIYLQIGHLFSRRNDIEKAQEWYDRLFARVPPSHQMALDARNSLKELADRPIRQVKDNIRLLLRSRQYDEACAYIEAQSKQNNNRSLYLVAAEIRRDQGDFDQAEILYNACDSEEEDFDLRFETALQRGHMEKIRHNNVSALKCYQEARRHQERSLKPSCTPDQVDAEINGTLSEISRSLLLLS